NGATLYEPAGLTPIFSGLAQIPVFPWKAAPTLGHIKGEARRADNTPLDTAAVTIKNLDDNTTRAAATDGGGFYGGVDLTPGRYLVRAALGQDVLYSCVANVAPGSVTTADLGAETVAPVTTVALAPAAPNGSNGWYTTDVTLSLAATDNCSGVERTEYSTDGGANWQPYAGNISISREGSTTISYRSIDRAGNIENTGSTTVNIDKTAPEFQLEATPTRIFPPNGKPVTVKLTGTGSDSTSGLSQVSYAVTDEYGTPLSVPTRALSGNSASWIDNLIVEARRNGDDSDGRLYRVTATVTDAAGNATSATVDIVVSHDRRP
ncbi:MAG TPA: carboxypeptidase-like regulatory domain-containing protein, partial [Pyrinomonadaceae bacterium]